MQVTEEQKQHVRTLLVHGRKIEAIKYLRDHFDLSLRESKRLAELIDEDIADHEYVGPPPVFTRAGSKAGSVIGLVFGIIGAIMLSLIIYLFISHQKFLETAEPAIGVVVSNPSQPVIDYEYKGQMYSYYSTVSSNPPSYELGEQVEVFVNPDNPTDVIVNTFTERWFVITLIGGMGLLFFGIGMAVFFAFRGR
ncbi:hypothetical protein C900_00884 [Fulvivirga imtechensis AK7]|uniref:DUF3592 domain-containing protein n=1 Tax=Fulvivirga imtechensis AK7 TaxID=1237149 RepID=L8JXL5_9BACT|nr:DUF3592 domain-containing protein [Fulvivirga imtechensis]ELR72923.1 hypothetical protein C900_00884 [Fulvivirga imtechensis AK7]